MTTTTIGKKGLEPGIYFNLPEEVYFDDPALSRSDIVKLLDSAGAYWQDSWMNKARKLQKKKTNPEMEYGKAFHMMLFEPKKFNKHYRIVPIDEFDTERETIQYDDFFAITESIKVLRKGKDSNLFLSGGVGEVTIVFDEYGHRYRTRHDYLSPVMTTDFKTTWSLKDQHLQKEFRDRGYDVQLALYKRSRVRFKEQFRAGEAHVYGDVDKTLFEQFMATEFNEFLFIFQRKSKPYPFLPISPEDDTEQSGLDKIQDATLVYAKAMLEYGAEKEWPVSEGKITAWSMFYGRRAE